MFENMNAAQVIEEIDALTAEEQSKVIAHLHQVQEKRFHEEQVRIAEQRLEDLDNGLTGTVSHDEAMRMICEGQGMQILYLDEAVADARREFEFWREQEPATDRARL